MTHLESITRKIVTLDEAKQIVAEWKTAGEKIVFTNGCFDIIHKGHVSYLAKARDLGTKLILGLNTDESVKRLKGVILNTFYYKSRLYRIMILVYERRKTAMPHPKQFPQSFAIRG